MVKQYIDKAALLAEIERYKHKADERLKIKNRTLTEDLKDLALQNLCGNLIHFIDALEVKEVDLDALGVLAEHLIACDAHLVTPKYTDKELNLLEEWAVNNKAQKGE